jgi:hypothetical protein
MQWDFWDVAVVLVSLLNLGLIGYVAFTALKLKNAAMGLVSDRVKPMTAKGKAIAETGKREVAQNKDRWQALTAEFKAVADAVRTQSGTASSGPQVRISYRTLLTGFSLLSTLRRGLGKVQTARKPTSNPPGPPAAKKKTPARTLGAIPEIVHLLLDVRRELRRR